VFVRSSASFDEPSLVSCAGLVPGLALAERAGLRHLEYPKYGIISRYFAYKQALLREAERPVRSGVLCETDDISYLRLHEFHDVVRADNADHDLIRQRRMAFRSYDALTPRRDLTSDGETIAGEYRRDDAPPGEIAGLPGSSGTVDGRPRVVTDKARADLEAGDILVTAYTDSSWTPLFLTAAGLVTEVIGLMTHGAVIAGEYGLPGVVGVHQATRLIRDDSESASTEQRVCHTSTSDSHPSGRLISGQPPQEQSSAAGIHTANQSRLSHTTPVTGQLPGWDPD
jgi:phosphohistidine swiveling domain-containing protein